MRMRVPLRAVVVFLLSCVFALALAAFPATKKPPVHPIDINSANSTQLQEVPGIGPATAEKILQMRKSYGAFKSVDDLMSVRGIGAKRLEKMRKYLVAGHSAQGRSPGASASTAAKPAACANCSRAAPVKKTAASSAVPAKASRSGASDGDAAEADEEPE
jgi:competence ComEA-like helix-hairpin-helix protein